MINYPLLSGGIISFIICVSIIPVLIKLSNKHHWFDEIDARKIHTGQISRLAGTAIFTSMVIGMVVSLILVNHSSSKIEVPAIRIASFMAAYILIHLIGLIDDFKNIRPRYKFIVQIIAALIVIIPNRTFSMLNIPFIDITLNIGPLGYILTLLWIIGACNAVNLIDGMDGLSGGITAIASFCLAVIAIAMGNIVTAVIAIALFGSIIGFLVFNFPPAKIFMGDSGSLFLGFALATLPLLEINYHSDMGFIISVSILFIPVIDTLTSMLRRLRRKQSPFNPDREHLHHKLMDRNFSTKQILLTIYTVSALLCLSLIIWSFNGNSAVISGTIIIWVILILISLLLEKHHAENK